MDAEVLKSWEFGNLKHPEDPIDLFMLLDHVVLLRLVAVAVLCFGAVVDVGLPHLGTAVESEALEMRR